jgi:hypothetical protein
MSCESSFRPITVMQAEKFAKNVRESNEAIVTVVYKQGRKVQQIDLGITKKQFLAIKEAVSFGEKCHIPMTHTDKPVSVISVTDWFHPIPFQRTFGLYTVKRDEPLRTREGVSAV